MEDEQGLPAGGGHFFKRTCLMIQRQGFHRCVVYLFNTSSILQRFYVGEEAEDCLQL